MRWIFVLCQGERAFYAGSVLLWYSTEIKGDVRRGDNRKDTHGDSLRENIAPAGCPRPIQSKFRAKNVRAVGTPLYSLFGLWQPAAMPAKIAAPAPDATADFTLADGPRPAGAPEPDPGRRLVADGARPLAPLRRRPDPAPLSALAGTGLAAASAPRAGKRPAERCGPAPAGSGVPGGNGRRSGRGAAAQPGPRAFPVGQPRGAPPSAAGNAGPAAPVRPAGGRGPGRSGPAPLVPGAGRPSAAALPVAPGRQGRFCRVRRERAGPAEPLGQLFADPARPRRGVSFKDFLGRLLGGDSGNDPDDGAAVQDAAGHINLNWRALLLPVPLLEHLCWHELCHLRQMNHSPAYRAELARFSPHWPDMEKELNRAWRDLPWWALPGTGPDERDR